MLETYIKDTAEKQRLFRAIDTVPAVKKKADWALKWIGRCVVSAATRTNQPLFKTQWPVLCRAPGGVCRCGGHLLLWQVCCDHLTIEHPAHANCHSFCAIFWLRKRGMMPGLTFSNELISRDEGLHCDFACLLYRYMTVHVHPSATPTNHSLLENKLDPAVLTTIIVEAVEIELEFVTEALPVDLIGMNSGLMAEYIRFVADRLLVAMDCDKHYNVANPFDWMETISLQYVCSGWVDVVDTLTHRGKTNFFEKRVGDYQKAGVMTSLKEGSGHALSFDDDF